MARLSTVEDYITEVANRTRAAADEPLAPPLVDPAQARASYLALAADHAYIDRLRPDDTRMRRSKRLVLRLTRHITHHQVVVNEALLGAFGSSTPATEEPSAIAAVVAALEVQLEHLQDEVAALRSEDQARRDGDEAARLVQHDDLYVAFEDRFRGSREEIKGRVSIYVDDLVAVATALRAPVLDLGAGRGELLELLGERGIDAYGVDQNAAMVERAGQLGVRIEHDDALRHLRTLDDSCLAGLVALHVVEHLPMADAVDLVREAHRVLRPGGRLLLETPNPTTLQVGANTFYLDPSHLRPVHPLYLEFLVDHVGFAEVEVRMLHPDEPPLGPSDDSSPPQITRVVDTLNAVYSGPRDYAVLATRPG